MDDETLRDLAPAYAMGTLALPDRVAFEAALAAHAWLREEVDAHRAVLDALATDARVAPPDALKARVLARIASADPVGDVAAGLAPVATDAADPHRTTGSATPPPRPIVVAGSDRRIVRTPRRWALPATLAAALAASIAIALSQRTLRTDAESRLAAAEGRVASLERRLDSASATLASVLDAEGDLTVVRLTATGAEVPGVRFYWNRTTHQGVLRIARLEPAPAGKAYQLWLIKDGIPLPMPAFNTAGDGSATLAGLEMPTDTRGVQ
ncbi:MAG: anti-sigma factor, partial [Gemmatimonadaceae bacterium]|nr:anti-sigma factor [Gemmatimonadaceae bacterium]